MNVFVDFAEKDANVYKEIRGQLIPLIRQKKIRLFSRKSIRAGQEVAATRKKLIEQSNIVLMLFSAAYYDCCYDEAQYIIEKHHDKECIAIIVVATAVLYEPFFELNNVKIFDLDKNKTQQEKEAAKIAEMVNDLTTPEKTKKRKILFVTVERLKLIFNDLLS